MALNSINTNNAALIAVQVLNATNSALQGVQKRIATGFRVADAVDDGAAFAVAERVRSDVGALTSANQQLGVAGGLLGNTLTGLNAVSTELKKARESLTRLADSSVIGDTRTQYQAQYKSSLDAVKTHIQDAGYLGKTLIGNISGSIGTFGSVAVIRNELGASYGIASFDGSAFYASLAFNTTQLGVSSALASISTSGVFLRLIGTLGTELNTYGAASNYVTGQVSYNSNKIDALNSGLGALIDADLTKESAQLQALQVRQQLGTQALSIANQSPQSLLKLFQ